jgi:hypothetical protein
MMRRSLLAGFAVAITLGGLAGCGTTQAPQGRLVLETSGLPAGTVAVVGVRRNQRESLTVSSKRSASLYVGSYTATTPVITTSAGVEYVPANRTLVTERVTIRFKIRSGKTTALVLKYAVDPTTLPVTAGWARVSTDTFPFSISSYSGGLLACASQDFCVAVASSPSEDGDLEATTWNGHDWTPPVDTGLANTSVDSLTCPSSQFCMMGTGGAQYHAPTFIDVWNGQDWVGQSPLGSSVAYYTAACASSTFCITVAEEFGNGTVGSAVWNGVAWTELAQPPVAPSGMEVGDLACSTAEFCTTTFERGGAGPPTPAVVGSVDVWDGTAWRQQTTLSVNSSEVGCAASNFCLLVGGQFESAEESEPNEIFATGTASRWNASVESGASGTPNYLYAYNPPVCAAQNRCFDVGALGPAGTDENLTDALLGWTGSTWTVVAAVSPGGTADQVACAPGGYCLEVSSSGTYARS